MKYYFSSVDGVIGAGVSYDDTIPTGAIECTQAQYDNAGSYTVSNGAIVEVAASAVLAASASTALGAAQNYVMGEYVTAGDAIPDAWTSYIKALKAIINGTDTTSTVLPAAPGS